MGKARQQPLGKMFLIPQDSDIVVMLFDVEAANGKRFVLGEGLGGIVDGELRASDLANLVMARLAKMTDAAQPVHLVELADISRVGRRLSQVFMTAPTGAAIMLFCRTPKIVDAILDFLPICRREPPNEP